MPNKASNVPKTKTAPVLRYFAAFAERAPLILISARAPAPFSLRLEKFSHTFTNSCTLRMKRRFGTFMLIA